MVEKNYIAEKKQSNKINVYNYFIAAQRVR